MQKFTNRFVIGVIVFLLAGCATVEDVQRATDIIRNDNELTRLLVEVRPNDQAGAATYLSGLATHAKSEADALKDNKGKIQEAIAYYRIAATAYWRSGNPEVVNDLFEVTDSGNGLCAKLGKNAPDRDCLFLQLVIPFAGLEANAKKKDLSGLLNSVNFNDRNASPNEIDTMGEISESLNQVKPLIQKIFTVGADNRFLSHLGMRDYYCENAKKAFAYYDNAAGVFATKVSEYYDNFPDNTPPLGITTNEAGDIQQLKENVPIFCQ